MLQLDLGLDTSVQGYFRRALLVNLYLRVVGIRLDLILLELQDVLIQPQNWLALPILLKWPRISWVVLVMCMLIMGSVSFGLYTNSII